MPGSTDLSMLPRLASLFRQISIELETAAERRADSERQRYTLESRRRAIHSAADIAANYMAGGMPFDQALEAASRATGLEADTIRIVAKRMPSRIQRAERNRKIMQMVARGYTDKQIAEHVGLKSPKSVNRIIRLERERAA